MPDTTISDLERGKVLGMDKFQVIRRVMKPWIRYTPVRKAEKVRAEEDFSSTIAIFCCVRLIILPVRSKRS